MLIAHHSTGKTVRSPTHSTFCMYFPSLQRSLLKRQSDLHSPASQPDNILKYLLRISCCLVFLSLLSIPQITVAQSNDELGTPLLTSWLPNDYGADPQMWSVTQDHRGVMYFGNNQGILEYDGVSWRLIQTSNKGRCGSLVNGPDGRVYAGCIGDFGYLAPDSLGQMQLFSLLHHAPDSTRDFADIWILKSIGESVYFSARYIFRWTPSNVLADGPHPKGEMKTFQMGNTAAGNAYHGGYSADETFYIRKLNEGMMRFQGDTLALVPDGERFADERIYVMLPFDNAGRTLVGSRTQGLFVYDGQVFTPFESEANQHLIDHELYMPGALLEDGWLLNTLSGGAVILDKQGQVVHTLDQSTGLADNTVISVYADPNRPEAQWLALNTGVARVEATGPFTIFNEARGLSSTVNKILRHEGRLYLATTVGVSWLNPNSGLVEPIDMPISEAWDLVSVDGYLLVATDNGVFQVDGNRATYLRKSLDNKSWDSFVLHQSVDQPNRVYVGVLYGLSILELRNNTWQDVGRVPGFEDEISSIAQIDPNTLWLGTRTGLIFKITFPNGDETLLKDTQVDRYTQDHGLPVGSISVYEVNDDLFFLSQEGIYRFDATANRFYADTTNAKSLAGKTTLAQGKTGEAWALGNGIAQGTSQVAGQHDWQTGSLERFSDMIVNTAYSEKNGVTWFGGVEGLIRYDSNKAIKHDAVYPALIRSVIVGEDSLIYGGGGNVDDFAINLDYDHNDLQIQYAATSYEDVGRLQFQSMLVGADYTWSNWNSRTERVYTNLDEGDYEFRVRAKNGFGHISQQATFSFSVTPPWYRSWFAYAGYAALAGLFLFGASRLQRQRLLAKEYKKAQQRESELRLKNELEIKRIEAESLKELDEMRTTFFANISHELRTPLTLILGQIESLKSEFTEDGPSQKLDMAMRNASRLHQLVNQLLDVAKIEAGKMPLQASQSDIISFLKKLFVSFESLAAQRQLGMRFYAAEEAIDVYFEPEKMEKIFLNLVSNAIKFTPDGGEVSVQIRQKVRQKEVDEQALVEIEVRDSGIGIPDDQLPFIFDRFFQVDSGKTRDYEGTGIGLSLAKELVELHQGTISVTSKEGLGTVFSVHLPLGRSHLTEGQIVLHDANAFSTSTSENTTDLSDVAEKASTSSNGKPDHQLVLIVEDNADMRTYIRENLDQEYEVLEAVDGQQGFEIARETVPDLIVSDVMMPAVDGYELSQKIRADELTCHIPIVMLTARAAEEAKLEGLESGVDAYLTKPFSTRELQVRVRKLIEMRRLLREQQEHPLQIRSSEVAVTSVDEAFLERLQTIVEEHLAEEDFQVESLCREIGVSERQLYRKLKALLNCTPAAYIRLLRLDRAKQLLEKNAGTVSEITFQVGYANTSAFARAFKEAYGKSPSEILKRDIE